MRFSIDRIFIAVASAFLVAQTAIAQPFGLTQRTTVTGLNIPLDDPAASGSGTGTVQLVRAFPNLSFSAPLFLASAKDGTNRIFVVEKGGRIRVFANNDSVASGGVTDFLDLTASVNPEGEQGLLGLAFDPNYAQNGTFYVHYNPSSGARRSRIARYTVSSNPNVANASSETIVLEIPQPAGLSNHKGGMIAFGKDNMLYMSFGDGGGGGDPNSTGQNCSELLGGILRIDPRSTTPYAIPTDNPFAGSARYNCGTLTNALSGSCRTATTTGQICKEIWAVGLRNPWRFSVDRVAGTIWIGDVGQNAWEEVDIGKSGANYGWNVYEGMHNYTNPSNLPLSNFTSPVREYDRNSGSSITGGYVYRGADVPTLYGKYVYGDYGSGRIWALVHDGSQLISNTQIASLGGVASFGEDDRGELYALSISNGTVHRFRPPTAPTGPIIPLALSQTGLFSNTAALQITPGGVEYDVNAQLWSDGARKRRWLLLPGAEKITFHPTEAYTFPVGTAIVKHFDLPISPTQTRRLETRLLFRHNQGWVGYTYKWNTAQTDADLLTESASEDFTVQDAAAPGGSRQQTWYYPSRTDCQSCHTIPSGQILGIRTRQLNHNFTYPAATDNQLRSWNHIALFTTDIGASTQYDSYGTYSDTSKPLGNRARAYLAANCAHCHQPGIPRSGELDMRYDTPISNMNVIDQRPTYGNLGLTDAYRVKGGSKESSVLWERMRRLDGFRMPPLASKVQDTEGIGLIGNWIDLVTGDNVAPGAPGRLRVE